MKQNEIPKKKFNQQEQKMPQNDKSNNYIHKIPQIQKKSIILKYLKKMLIIGEKIQMMKKKKSLSI